MLAVVIVLVVLCGGAGLLVYFSGVFGGSDPTEVVEDYFAAAQRGDCAKMIELVTEESWRQGGATSRAQAISECEQGMAELGMSGVPVWQRNYYEHVIRSEEALNRIRRYIADNPMRWALDPENPASWDANRRGRV